MSVSGEHFATMSHQSGASPLKVWRPTLAVALAYLVAAQFSLSFILQPEAIAPFWLASGVSLAALILTPPAIWPYLLGGVLAVNLGGNLYRGYDPAASAGFALANIVEPWLGAWLIRRRISAPLTLDRLGHTVTLLLAAAIATAVGALLGAATGALTAGNGFRQLWQLWWIDDLIGILALTPLIITAAVLARQPLHGLLRQRDHWLLLCWLVLLAALAVFVFAREIPAAGYFARSAFLVFPLMLWLAIRFGPVGTALGGFLVTVIAVWGTVLGNGPFVIPESSQAQQVLAMQIFLSVTMISSLLLASLIKERDLVIQRLRETQANLEERLAFEKRLAEVSAGFIDMPISDIDTGIRDALSEFSRVLGMDRAHVLQFAEDGRHFSATHEWVNGNLPPLIDKLQNVNRDSAPWFFDQLSHGDHIMVIQTDELPPQAQAEKRLLDAWGKKSLLIVPLYVDGSLTGVVSFSTVRRKRQWPDSLIPQVQLISDVFANALVRRRSVLALQTLNAGLEQRVDERTADLNALNRELEAFSYTVSHDLRAPLRRIAGFANALREDGREKLDAQCAEYLQRIQAGTEDMTQLIEGLLGLSRVSRQPMDLVPVDLSAVADAVAADLRAEHPQQEVEFHIARTQPVNGDPALLRALLDNLIGNAWKYSRDCSQPRIEFGQETLDGKTVYFVRDNGIGFDMKHAETLFIPFQRLHAGDGYDGSGIGLATAQRIVHRHGGRIWAESHPGGGSVFRFTLGD